MRVPHNLPEQLRIAAKCRRRQQAFLISDYNAQAYLDDLLGNTIRKAIRQRGSMMDIRVWECMKEEGKVWYKGKRYVPEGDQFWLQLIQENHDTALAGHQGRATMFDLLD